jgi:hypothetical protein
MSDKGRKSRQGQHKSTDRGQTLKAIFKTRRVVDRKHVPSGKAWGAWRARQLLADTFTQAPVGPGTVEGEVCTGCGLEQWAWLGSQGEGYIRNGHRYCCQGCADRRICPCQG